MLILFSINQSWFVENTNMVVCKSGSNIMVNSHPTVSFSTDYIFHLNEQRCFLYSYQYFFFPASTCHLLTLKTKCRRSDLQPPFLRCNKRVQNRWKGERQRECLTIWQSYEDETYLNTSTTNLKYRKKSATAWWWKIILF